MKRSIIECNETEIEAIRKISGSLLCPSSSTNSTSTKDLRKKSMMESNERGKDEKNWDKFFFSFFLFPAYLSIRIHIEFNSTHFHEPEWSNGLNSRRYSSSSVT